MYHLTVKTQGRHQGKRIVASAAYRSGQKLYDKRYDRTHDFTNKGGVVHTEIICPPNAPPRFSNRAILWNTVERVENRKDSRLAREVEFALPRELTLAENIELAKSFIAKNFVSLGMCADLCIHHNDERNPHAHVLITDRPVDGQGFMAQKDPSWNQRKLIRTWRKSWEQMLNNAYKEKGLEKQVSCESYKTLGIVDRKPTKHLGRRVIELAKQGQETDRIREHIDTLVSPREREKHLRMIGKTRKQEKVRDRPLERSR